MPPLSNPMFDPFTLYVLIRPLLFRICVFTYSTLGLFFFFILPNSSSKRSFPLPLQPFPLRFVFPENPLPRPFAHRVLWGVNDCPRAHNQETVDSYCSIHGTLLYRDQICIMYSRLDYARWALSNFPMSHTRESVSGKLIHENPIVPAGAIYIYGEWASETTSRGWSGHGCRTNNNSAGQWSGISIYESTASGPAPRGCDG